MPDSPAQAAGLRPGDLLVRIDGRAIRSAAELYRVLDRKSIGSTVPVALLRGTARVELTAVGRQPG